MGEGGTDRGNSLEFRQRPQLHRSDQGDRKQSLQLFRAVQAEIRELQFTASQQALFGRRRRQRVKAAHFPQKLAGNGCCLRSRTPWHRRKSVRDGGRSVPGPPVARKIPESLTYRCKVTKIRHLSGSPAEAALRCF